jgi:hypothetical protein
MKRLLKRHALIGAFLMISASVVFATGGYKVINFDTVKHPQSLVSLLNALYTEVTALRTLANELRTDHAATRTADLSQTALINQIRQATLYGALGNPGFVIDTNFDVKNGNAISYTNGGTLKTLTANTSFDTGTTKTITGGKWGAAMLTATSAAAALVTWASGAGYDSEALAIAGLAAPTETDTVLGYLTVHAHASGFTAGTDALTTGTGGNVAQATNYYNSINPNSLMIGAAVSDSPPATLTAPAVTQQVQKGK